MSISLLIKEKSYQDVIHEKKFLANISQKKMTYRPSVAQMYRKNVILQPSVGKINSGSARVNKRKFSRNRT